MDRESARILLIVYMVIIVFGSGVLLIPNLHNGELTFLDSLFTVTSATTSTGLIVKSTAKDFTFLGQFFILLLIQVGGFGYMCIVTFMYVFFKNSFIKHKILNINTTTTSKDDFIIILKNMLFLVFIIEILGSIGLFIFFIQDMTFLDALWASIFHSISSFNNAGFSIFDTGMLSYVNSHGINFIIMFLVILGGIGYFVLLEIFWFKKRKIFSIHTKVVLLSTFFIILFSFSSVFLFEYNNTKTIGAFSIPNKIFSALFTAVNYRTSGFNILDLSNFRDVSLFFASLFMVIGGSPAGTAGGIKTTTLVILIFYAVWSIRGEHRTILFKRQVDQNIVNQSFAIIVLTFFVLVSSLMLMALFEDGEKRGFLALLFEICSAFSTTGLSTGDGGILSLSAHFSEFGKFLIIILMFIGKIGILAFLISFFKKRECRVGYLETKILI